MARPKNPSRRKFLKGDAPSQSPTGDTITTESLADWVADPQAEAYLIRIGRRAMACQFQIFLNAGQYADDSEMAIGALDEIDELEALLTVYRADSEVSTVNDRAAAEAVTLSDSLAELLELCLAIFEATDGAFDVTAGPLADLWSRARRSGSVPPKEAVANALTNVGSELLRLDHKKQQVRFLRPGVSLNFGGIGKGFALEAASRHLKLQGVDNFLFHGGRSSVLASGCRASGSGEEPWLVGLVDPLRPSERLAEIVLRDRALSTSGSQAQSFQYRGRRYGHILDPRSGFPAEGDILSATVMHPDAAWADALSTALYVLGSEKAVEFCRAHPEIAAILIVPGRGTGNLEIKTSGLSPDEWRLVTEQKIPIRRVDG
ncbi:MAG: FAD:protein FMN transferase [Planctomycetota bacterium]|nr:FAD:protein FMN transferase [Planctomycetota bacterium]